MSRRWQLALVFAVGAIVAGGLLLLAIAMREESTGSSSPERWNYVRHVMKRERETVQRRRQQGNTNQVSPRTD